MNSRADIGLIGLGVMGSHLIQNIERNGCTCAVYNRTPSVTDHFMKEQQGKGFTAARTLPEFVALLKPPRKILVMVQAGKAVDAVLDALLGEVSEGDLIADLGNSYFTDTNRREKRCQEQGVQYLGVGVSGGEKGALLGPSIMPGGSREAWKMIAPIFDAIAAKAPEPCHAYIGPHGAGHFVKMVHNGIEYADMQLIAESYHILREVGGMAPPDLAQVFDEWNKGPLSSYLIEITAEIFRRRDDLSDGFLVDAIVDRASQKGTGKWTAQVALDLGCPIPTVAIAVDARQLSSMKEERVKASKILPAGITDSGKTADFVRTVHDALYCAKIVAYAQGMALLQAASREWTWNLNLAEISSIWRAGCIIRARFLSEIMRAFSAGPDLPNLLLDSHLKGEIAGRLPAWREIASLCALKGLPALGIQSALSYYDSYRAADLPQNLTQAQRDFFGAHTYERRDRGGIFHTGWE